CNTDEARGGVGYLARQLRSVDGAQDVSNIASITKQINGHMNEGSLKWGTVSRDQYALNNAMRYMPSSLYNMDCSLTAMYVFLDDHKAETLDRVTSAVETYNAEHGQPDVINFKLASGNAGVEA